MKRLRILLLLLLVVQMGGVAHADTPQQESGQAYVVQAGDWLSKLADRFYGDPQAWPVIVEATNAKATADSSFASIADPNVIEVGQKLWIPDTAEGYKPAAEVPSEEDLKETYQKAIQDAQIAEPDEISRDLVAIVESNTDLVWDGQRVLVVTWTSYGGYDDQVGQSVTLERQIWVTAVPELRDSCRAYKAAQPDLTLRLEQLLGLPPNNGKTKFVEMWVYPRDLFRPSPDPETTDHEAELNFPASRYLSVSAEYVAWFTDLQSRSYGENGYPWTRLGYTYDWGNPDNEVGLSEFVINQGSTVEIHLVSTTAAYCHRN